jgi:hypothetical protein
VLHMAPGDKVDVETHSVFRSLLGGVAWLAQTRPDVAIYISCLQRHMDKPTAKDVFDLNRVLKYIKRKPLIITYRAVAKPWCMAIISDSAFQSKDQDCLAVRSGVIALTSNDNDSRKILQPLEYVCKKQNHVCRSTYAAELHSALDLCGLALLINQTLTEVLSGVMGPSQLLEIHNSGQHSLSADLYLDAKSVFDSLVSKVPKTPADKVLLLHVLALQQHLTLGQLRSISWIDTRDMIADALNKGSIDRGPLRALCESGQWNLLHEKRTVHGCDIGQHKG